LEHLEKVKGWYNDSMSKSSKAGLEQAFGQNEGKHVFYNSYRREMIITLVLQVQINTSQTYKIFGQNTDRFILI
jgi:hypothetical protein